ncbi:uncharacterized protein LOC122050632 [Zingiber officinale]|uniref:uncharacterized protein LOC122050632 n=1 Tax=Zingiber officinale TaxID=94328 RepID=UPI001C4CB91D|nr:uncharacterized protein LOC122050632 [Zingiber officinale]
MVADEVDKGMEEANEASRVKRHRVLNFFSDDDGATAVNEHLSSEVREDSTSAKICTQNLQSNLTCSDDRFLFSNEVLDPSSDEWMENYFNDSEMYCNSKYISFPFHASWLNLHSCYILLII